MVLTPTQLDAALNMLAEDFHTTPCELFLSLIRSTMHHQHSAFIEVIHRSPAILAAMEDHPHLSDLYLNTAKELVTRQCKNEVVKLSSKSNEFHFAANSMTEEQIRAYQVSDAIEKVSTQAPILWGLLLSLLSSDDDINDRRRYLNQCRHEKRKAGEALRDEEIDEDEIPDDSDDEPEDAVDQAVERRQKLSNIVSIYWELSEKH